MTAIKKNTRAEILIIFTTVIWGGTFVVIKNGLNDASPLMFLGLRFGAAFIPYFLIFRKHFYRLSRQTVFRAFILSLFFFCGYAMQTIGLSYTTVAKSSLFTYLFALVVPPLQFFFTGKKLNAENILGLVIVVSGMVVFTRPGNSSLNIGDFLTMAGAAGYAFFILFIDRYSDEENPVVLTGFQFLISALLSFVLSLLLEEPFVNPGLNLYISIAYLALPGSILAIYLMNRYQGDITPLKACLLYSLEPVFSIIFGWIILHETLSFSESMGALLILGGVLASELIGHLRSLRHYV